MTRARGALGDRVGARAAAHEGLLAAARAHLPLAAVRIRLAVLTPGQMDERSIRLTGQLRGPGEFARTDLPISIRFEKDQAWIELDDPMTPGQSLRVLIEDLAAHQLFGIIALYSR